MPWRPGVFQGVTRVMAGRPTDAERLPGRDLGPTAAFLEQVGSEVRRRRQAHEMTVQQLADASGVSRAMLTQIELGQANPSLVTVDRLARALGVDFATLAGATARPPVVVTGPEDQVVAWSSDSGSYGRLLVAGGSQGGAELWEWLIAPGDRYEASIDPPGAEELLLVTEGHLLLDVGERQVDVEPGQAVRLASDRPYKYLNPGRDPVRFVRVSQII